MFGFGFCFGLLIGGLMVSFVDYYYVKKTCEKCFIDFKNFTHFYKMRSQKKRHNNKKINKKVDK